MAVATTAGGLAGWVLAAAVAGLALSERSELALLGAFALAYGAAAAGFVRLPLPETRRQVPASWRYRFSPPVTAALYGALLAPGVGTQVASPGYVIVLAGASLSGRPVVGAGVLAAFAFVRSASAVVVGTRHGGSVVMWGYELRPLWAFLAVLQTAVVLGATAALLMVNRG